MWKRGLGIIGLLMTGCPQGTVEPMPAGPLEAGIAVVEMPAPLGIGTVGNLGIGVESLPSPFAELYPSTDTIHGHPEFKVVVLSRGPGRELVFVRSDLIGVFQQLRRAVVLQVEERTGRDLDDALIFGATHTHSGPGRVVDRGGPFDLIADRFFPEFYQRMVDAASDAIVAAFEDLEPARVGWTIADIPEGHNDRRCEDGGPDYTNGAFPIVSIERNERVEAVIGAYAVHGTGLGIDELTLSQDVFGAIEESIEHGFEHPVEALVFSSWSGDMSPNDPDVPEQEGAKQRSGYDDLERLGVYVAEEVLAVIEGISYDDDPEIALRTWRTPLDRQHIGYGSDEFPYEYGGVYCGLANEADCDVSTTEPENETSCVPFTYEFPAPNQTVLSVGQIGGLHLLTFPGEPGTKLSEGIVDHMMARDEVEGVLFLGYAQDYIGYSILEEDWWQGGYEAAGALWGPRQGSFLQNRAKAMFDATIDDVAPSAVGKLEPPPVAPFEVGDFTPYSPDPGIDVGLVLEDVAAEVGRADVVSMVVSGNDPWLGPVSAVLETEEGAAVLRPNTEPWTSDTYAFWLELENEPNYEEQAVGARTFGWRINLPVQHRVVGAGPELEAGGRYRLRVSVPQASGEPLEVLSSVFAVRAE